MYKKHGFTLIELLVVVLIIGILSAVALPQYTKAVEKSRLAELMTIQNSLEKAADIYLLSNGLSNAGDIVGSLDIDFPDFVSAGGGLSHMYCNAKKVCFTVLDEGGQIQLSAGRWPTVPGVPYYDLVSNKSSSNGKWARSYYSAGVDLANFGLESLGYTAI